MRIFFSLEFLHKRLEHSGVLQFQLIEPCATSSERAWWKKEIVSRSATKSHHCTKKKISIKDFFGKCYQLRRKLRIWSHLFKKFSVENFIFCAVHSVSDKKEKSEFYGKRNLEIQLETLINWSGGCLCMKNFLNYLKTSFVVLRVCFYISFHKIFCLKPVLLKILLVSYNREIIQIK